MKIVHKQTYRVNLILTLSLVIFSAVIYWLYAAFRQHEFYNYLKTRAITLEKLLIDEGISGRELRYMQELQQDIFSQQEFVVYDSVGMIVYKSLNATSQLTAERKKEVFNKEIEFKKGGYEHIFFVTQDNGHNKKLIIEASGYDLAGLNNQRKLLYTLLGGSFVMIAIVAFFTRYFIKKDLHPLEKIARKMEKISGSNFSNRLTEASLNNEIGQLAQTFNQLIDRLETAYSQQLNFVSYATHELRTPLSILLGNAQVTLMKKRTTEEYEQTINAFQTDINRMNELVNSLLELARVNAGAKSIFMTDTQFDDQLWLAVDLIKQKQPGAQVNVEFGEIPDDTEAFVVHGNPDLLMLGCRNIIENACKYSEDETVNIRLATNGKYITATFSDNGHGIAAEEIEHIFEAYYRTDTTIEISGHGIGLPLTKRIIELHNGRISVKSVVGTGSVFTVELPVKKAGSY